MINYFKTEGDTLKEIVEKQPNCWVSVQEPTDIEIDYLVNTLGVSPALIGVSLDTNKKSLVLTKDDQILILLDAPVEISSDSGAVQLLSTLPIGFIFCSDFIVSITGVPSTIIDNLHNGVLDDLNTLNQDQLVFSIIYYISNHFVMHLESIDYIVFKAEFEPRKSMKNQELVEILKIQKSLVYFIASLKSTKSTLEKIQRNKLLDIDDDDNELLTDTIAEVRQTIESATIYTEVLSSTIDTVSSISTNNVNHLMKILTSLTLVLSVPNMIFGFYGMNVAFHADEISFLLPLFITILSVGFCTWILYKKDLF